MGVDAVVALAVGRLYDKKGPIAMIGMLVIGIIIPFAAFSSGYTAIIISAVLWGAVMGIQETVLRAAVADYKHISRRGTAYGIFNTVYGFSWLIGSIIIGWAYSASVEILISYVVIMQLFSLPVFVWAKRGMEKSRMSGINE
jgi:MFS family permease